MPSVSLIFKLCNLCHTEYWQIKKKPLLASTFEETKYYKIHCNYPLLMFSLNTCITSTNIKNGINIDLDSIKKSNAKYEYNSLKYSIIDELNEKYVNRHKIFTKDSKKDLWEQPIM